MADGFTAPCVDYGNPTMNAYYQDGCTPEQLQYGNPGLSPDDPSTFAIDPATGQFGVADFNPSYGQLKEEYEGQDISLGLCDCPGGGRARQCCGSPEEARLFTEQEVLDRMKTGEFNEGDYDRTAFIEGVNDAWGYVGDLQNENLGGGGGGTNIDSGNYTGQQNLYQPHQYGDLWSEFNSCMEMSGGNAEFCSEAIHYTTSGGQNPSSLIPSGIGDSGPEFGQGQMAPEGYWNAIQEYGQQGYLGLGEDAYHGSDGPGYQFFDSWEDEQAYLSSMLDMGNPRLQDFSFSGAGHNGWMLDSNFNITNDFENGTFGQTTYAQKSMSDYQRCMQESYEEGNYNGMSWCTEAFQSQYVTMANDYYLNEAESNDPTPYNEEGWGYGLDVMCFGVSGKDVFGNQKSLLNDSTFLESSYNPASSECASWAQYKGYSREHYFNNQIKDYLDISFEDWSNQYAQTWDSDPHDLYTRDPDQGPNWSDFWEYAEEDWYDNYQDSVS